MKIAILLPGYPRKYMTACETLKAPYVDKYDCDFFIHAWYPAQGIEDANIYSGYINAFKPKKFLLEKQILFDPSTTPNKWNMLLQNVISQFYSLKIVNSLKTQYEQENNFKYDVVMRMRPDIRLNRPISPLDIDRNCINLYNWTVLGFGHLGLSDVFAMGTSELMDIYCDLYSNIKYYLTEDATYNMSDGDKQRPEYLMRHHLLTAKKLSLKTFHHNDIADRSFEFVR